LWRFPEQGRAGSFAALQPDSALIDCGVDLTQLGIDSGGRDFAGGVSPRGAGFDIGASEQR
jgi:hypothetical protein